MCLIGFETGLCLIGYNLCLIVFEISVCLIGWNWCNSASASQRKMSMIALTWLQHSTPGSSVQLDPHKPMMVIVRMLCLPSTNFVQSSRRLCVNIYIHIHVQFFYCQFEERGPLDLHF